MTNSTGEIPVSVTYYQQEEVTDIKSNAISARDFQLLQNYPNPFNPRTTIMFKIPVFSFVTLKLYDPLGNEIVTLISEEKTAGTHHVNFDASNLASGIYFYKIQAGNFSQTKKLIFLK